MPSENGSRFFVRIHGSGRHPWFYGYDISRREIDDLFRDLREHPRKYFGKKGKPIPRAFLEQLGLPPGGETTHQSQRWRDVAKFFEIPQDKVGLMIRARLGGDVDFISWLHSQGVIQDLKTGNRSEIIKLLARKFEVNEQQMYRFLKKKSLL